MTYTENREFSQLTFTAEKLPKGEYESCTFGQCNFSNSDLSAVTFLDCELVDCNLSLATLSNTAFKNVQFRNCKLLGLHFENCNPFLLEMYFDGCQLNLSSFYKLILKKTRFKNCTLHEVDFTEADFTNSSFADCDMTGCIFDRTTLEKADFRTAFNYSIDPENNRLKQAKFSLEGVVGLLHKYNVAIES